MVKKSKLATPEWILEGYDSEEEYNKKKGIKHHSVSSETLNAGRKEKSKTSTGTGKIRKIKVCPKCGSDDVGVVLSGSDFEGESNTGREWECRKCKWVGEDVKEKELTEDEFIKYMGGRE